MSDYFYKTWGSTRGVFQEGDTVVVFGHKGYEDIKVLRIPEKIKIRNIWTPIHELNLNNRNIEELTVPATVRKIDSIFSKVLRRLIILGDGCRIEDDTFTKCTALTEVYMPSRCLRYLKAFKGTPWYDKFVSGLKGALIDNGTLIKVKDAVDYVVPEGVTGILENAFELSPNLRSVTLPESIEHLDYAFKNCKSLENVVFPKCVKSGTTLISTFEGCTSLRELKIPEGVESLDGTCRECKSLKKVNLPKGLKSIGYKYSWYNEGAFANCTDLTEINITDDVEKMNRAFVGCISLKKIHIPKSVTNLKEAFIKCTSLETIENESSVEITANDCEGTPYYEQHLKK